MVAESHGARIMVVGSREGAHPRFFLFPFIKHVVLNGQTAHTKGCIENRCVPVAQPVIQSRKPSSGIPALPHRSMRLHCHSFLVNTKTRIVR